MASTYSSNGGEVFSSTSSSFTAVPDYELNLNSTTDGISAVRFHRNPAHPNLLLVSSWDSMVGLYDVQHNMLKASYQHKAAVLDCCFSENFLAFSGGLDHVVKMYDFGTATERTLGSHEKAVKTLAYSEQEGLLITGSWDKNVKLWDIRGDKSCTGTYEQSGKVYTLDVCFNRVVVGTSDRRVLIYDIRNMSQPEQDRESTLKFQTRAIACYPNGTGYALSSIEGRVAMEYFDPAPEVQARKYAFKCHRAMIDGVDTVYPVNAIAFHPTFGTFATGGCDRVVSIWDGENKKRLHQFNKFPTSISSMSFNADGSALAIASSYTFEEGEKDHPADSIVIHSVIEGEVKPKARLQQPQGF